jgi:hypothetical protein
LIRQSAASDGRFGRSAAQPFDSTRIIARVHSRVFFFVRAQRPSARIPWRTETHGILASARRRAAVFAANSKVFLAIHARGDGFTSRSHAVLGAFTSRGFARLRRGFSEAFGYDQGCS